MGRDDIVTLRAIFNCLPLGVQGCAKISRADGRRNSYNYVRPGMDRECNPGIVPAPSRGLQVLSRLCV